MKSLLKDIVVSILSFEAQWVLARARPTVIAVTGTVGKTGTKDAIAAALVAFATVRKSEKSYNSELGIPLAILGERNQWGNPFGWFGVFFRGLFSASKIDFLVLEVGTDKPGDIRAITRWLRPHAVVVTRLSRTPVHVENFKSVGELIAEKRSLVESVREYGTLILNADDADVLAFRALAPHKERVISFGYSESADIRASEFGARIATKGALGAAPIYAGLAALAVAGTFGFDLERAARAIAERTPAPGRMRLLAGARGAQIIDDSYNSSPVAVAEALRTLADFNMQVNPSTGARGKKFAVLGDMLELGEFSSAEHEKMVREAVQIADAVFLVGERAQSTGILSPKIQNFGDARAAGEALATALRDGDVALIKGSQGMRMERAVALCLRDQSLASTLLVRQEKEWLKR